MATLKHLMTGQEFHLCARSTVGRASACHLRIPTSKVSGFHAELFWDGASWWVRDLGSRNGTSVDERRLAPGEQSILTPGTTLAFGLSEHSYLLTSVTPPQLMAAPDHGEPLFSDCELLCLPSPDSCELTIFIDGNDRWVVESDSGTRAIEDQELVSAGGRAWRVSLPTPIARTRDTRQGLEPTTEDIALNFIVSRDGEHITLVLTHDGTPATLEYRAHHNLLLALARARLADVEQPHLPASEHGWTYREQLCDEFDIDGQLLNLWTHRARQQFARAGIRAAGGLIERRAGTGQLRIGVEKLAITRS